MSTEHLVAVRAAHARLLRRLVMAPTNELVESFDDASPRELVESILDAPQFEPSMPTLTDDSDFSEPFSWWVSVMLDERSGFRERMVWFWHGHLTSSILKTSGELMLGQQRLLRGRALSNFRELLREITLDPAMLHWLDGAGSDASAPNENYARELMELFTLGRASRAYTETDVRSAARALAGYWVDGDAGHQVVFEPDGALRSPVDLFGARVQTVDDVIDTVCDHEACAPHVVASVYGHFVGTEIPAAVHDELTDVLRSSDLDIAQLVRAMLLHPTFLDGPAPRPRPALEWYLGYQRMVGADLDIWRLDDLGQMPMQPPNVAGWPGDERWLSAGQVLTKAKISYDMAWDVETLDPSDPVGDVLRRAVLYDVGPTTRAALDEIVSSIDSKRDRSTLLHATVAMCPEFSVI